MKIRNKAVPAVYILLEKNGKFLIGRRCNTGYQDGNYQLPAGHVEESELPTEAIIRETKEELGIDLSKSSLDLMHIGYRPKHDDTGDRIDLFFKTKKWKGEIKNMEPHKCDDLKWVTFDDLPQNFTPHVREAINCIKKGVFFKELDINFLKESGTYML